MSADGFNNFWLSFFEENSKYVLLTAMKLLSKCKNPSSKPLQEACSSLPMATPVALNVVPKAACNPENSKLFQ
jgi:hypothetical protein